RSRFEIDGEADATVVVNGHATAVDDTRDQRANEAIMLIPTDKLPAFRQPTGRYMTLADHLLRLHFEDVGKIGPQHDFEVEAGALRTVITNLKVLYDAIGHGTRDDYAQGRACDFAILRHHGRIDEVGARGVIGNGARVLQHPALPIGIERVLADVTRVTAIEPLVGLRQHRSIGFGENERISMVDRHDRWANSNFYRHVSFTRQRIQRILFRRSMAKPQSGFPSYSLTISEPPPAG